jgi:hypothetical protein
MYGFIICPMQSIPPVVPMYGVIYSPTAVITPTPAPKGQPFEAFAAVVIIIVFLGIGLWYFLSKMKE